MADEKRLIDANALMAEYCDGCRKEIQEDCKTFPVCATMMWVVEAPTVDAVEVVHAYWTGSRFNPMTDEYEEYCSHCCAWSSEYGKPYCPNCGAKMDGDVNG